MRFNIDLVHCTSWKQAQALQFMLDCEGFAAVAATGVVRDKEVHAVAAFAPEGYSKGLELVAGIFALDSEEVMLKVFADIKTTGVPRNQLADTINYVQREEVRKALTESLVYAYTNDGGRQRKVVGGWVAPAVKPVMDHDTGDEDTLPGVEPFEPPYVFDKFAPHGRKVSYPSVANPPKPDAYDAWKPAR